MKKNEYGVFEITVPAKDGNVVIPHGSKVKVGSWKLNTMEYPIKPHVCSFISRFLSPCRVVSGRIAFRPGSSM